MGSPRKNPAERLRRNPDLRVRLTDEQVKPRRPVPRGRWLKASREWWETFAGSPQASQFIETDWQYLTQLLHLVDRFYRCDPDDSRLATSLLAEVRQGQRQLGATIEDRRRLHIDVMKPEAVVVSPSGSARERWAAKVEGGDAAV